MKLYVALLLHAISILAFAGSTLSDTESGCPLVHGNKARNVNDMLADTFDRCFRKVGKVNLRSWVKNSQSASNPFFRKYCQRQELIKNCISTASLRSSACLNETEHNVFGFLENVLKTTLSYGCVDHGEHLTNVMYRVSIDSNFTTEKNPLMDCFAVAKSSWVEGDNLDTSTRVLGFYREIKVFKHCLMDRMRGMNIAVFGAELILNGILRSMNCPHPEDGTVTLCETIDTTLSTEEKVCPFDGIFEDYPPRADNFLDYGSQCVKVNLNQLDFDHLKTFTTIEDYRSFFNTYCQNQPYILNCLGDVSSNSKVCQYQTNHQGLRTYTEFIDNLLKKGCKQDGETFATIASGLFNSGEKSVGNNTMRCLELADGKLKVTSPINGTLPSKLICRVIESLKQCILDGSSDVGEFKTVFASFMNEILRAVKCVNPDDGATVHCETLVTN